MVILVVPAIATPAMLRAAKALHADHKTLTATNIATRPIKTHLPTHQKRSLESYRRWGLDERDWLQYQWLVEGPRGLWTPHLDPLLVLGIHAPTEPERQRYAQAFVDMEQERLHLELRFQETVNQILEQQLKPGNQGSIATQGHGK
jgi:hypothetical protein